MKLRLTTGTLSVISPEPSSVAMGATTVDQLVFEGGWIVPAAPVDVDQLLAEAAYTENNAPVDVDQLLAEVAWVES